MSLDQQGSFWLSNPWVAAFAIVVAVGLLLWCDLSRATDDSEPSVAVPVRARKTPRTPVRTEPSSLSLSCQVAVERERRDASRRRVA